ncbi:hypothetical protein NE237_019720 [Protea cynaroides]|uniref:Uncharacterized protein n=1 Tax=Protea cynaroides TaxID=273540 RepID=A0A9Q0K2S4_9MAGN|nr:hypothetical protein NE237_019720 [Protea cynaroides]
MTYAALIIRRRREIFAAIENSADGFLEIHRGIVAIQSRGGINNFLFRLLDGRCGDRNHGSRRDNNPKASQIFSGLKYKSVDFEARYELDPFAFDQLDSISAASRPSKQSQT